MMTLIEYKRRRFELLTEVKSGIILFFGNSQLPMNCPGNPLPYRQDSSFLYFTGISVPGLSYIMDCETSEEILIGHEHTLEDTIWSGHQKKLSVLAAEAGIQKTGTREKLIELIKHALTHKRSIHFLPPYPPDRKIWLSNVLGLNTDELALLPSEKLIHSVIAQRSIKSVAEITEIESALSTTTREMHLRVMNKTRPGLFEYNLVAEMLYCVNLRNTRCAYTPICTVRGETLHNEYYGNQLQAGQLLLVDAAAESSMQYASDITRTIPVGGKFSPQQKEIYELVLDTQLKAIDRIAPGTKYTDIHREAALTIAKGLIEIGLMKGDADEAVAVGAHALFFPHGLGHMLGLDVHDMEDLGENKVGYTHGITRSQQFGAAYLRLARKLEPGFVLTVEPGIYFIPTLIDLWKKEKKYNEFINYSALTGYRNFGGIRIEDNIAVTATGNKILGERIPKTIEEIEGLMNK